MEMFRNAVRPAALKLIALLSAACLAVGLTPPGQAHQIESALQYLDGDLELSTRFSNGEPASGAVVRLLNPDGTPGLEPYRAGTGTGGCTGGCQRCECDGGVSGASRWRRCKEKADGGVAGW